MVEYNYVKEFVEKSIKTNWNQPALSDYQGGTYTYGDVAKQIHKLHKIFDYWGVKQGEKVALIGRNNANWGIIYLATVSYGAVIVPILPDFSTSDVHNIVNHSDSVMLFAGEMVWGNLDEAAMPNLRAIFSVNDFNILVNKDINANDRYNAQRDSIESEIETLTADRVNYAEVSNANLGVISYTSGTTGFSKGVMLPLNSLAANVDYGRKNIGLVSGDRIVSFLPLAHAFGCAFEFLMPFAVGCHVTFLTRIPTPQIILKAFGEIKPRLVLAVPLIIEKIYKKQLLPKISSPAMKILMNIPLVNNLIFNKINKKLSDVFGGEFLEIVIGGAALNPEVESFLRKIKFRYTVGYGMTECGPLISYSGWKTNPQGSCGKTINYLEVKIDSSNPENEPGEILIRGENVMEGYYKNPEATSKTLVDGWLRSGDLGVMDRHGFIHIMGRSKSMILGPSGQNIYPEEIEARLNNLPFIQESLIVEQKGKLVGLIYPDYESMQQHGLSDNDIAPVLEQHRVELNKHLPQYSQVVKLQIYNQEFEKTPKKSIKRFLYQFSDN
ncbi:MAG: long-chain fatty acid--CoA ligase [Bacteroidales bacterium]|nr:MAG: long-chain fatty acid--CoA ligase [Bacteroidales bacterium]